MAVERWEAENGDGEGEEGSDGEADSGDAESVRGTEEVVGEEIRAATVPAARAERLEVRNLHPERVDFAQLATLHGMR